MMTAACLKTYTLKVNNDGSLANPTDHPDHPDHRTRQHDPEGELDRMARVLVNEQGLTYSEALSRTMTHPDNVDLVREYHEGVQPPSKPVKDDPGAALHTKALEIMEKDDCASYSQACAVAIERNPDLGARWNT